ncbi:MAG TPA: transglutaminase family protein [Hyphomicrobiaceae bacterium]
MTLHVALTHKTLYRYDRPLLLGPQVVRLRPAPHCRTPILSYALQIAPARHFTNWQQDPFGNFLARVVVPDETRELGVTVDLVAAMAPFNPFDFFIEDGAANWPFAYPDTLAAELAPYLAPPPREPTFDTYVAGLGAQAKATIDFVCDLNRRLSVDIAYRTRMEPGVQTPRETLEMRSGSCRDSGWLLVEMLRRIGLAARFVSGYLIQLRPDDAPPGAREDFADLHAWAEVYIPGAGWIGLDPTSGLLAGEGHIPLAATPTPTSAAPITGTHGEGKVEFSATLAVTRLDEKPRAAAPYSEPDWQAILAAGAAVDQRLAAGDVRLSMGGEPTFVALSDPGAPEWNIAALGPTKRDYADKLARRLRERFAPGGLLHYGQGKWYPGEAAPRWAHSIHWRTDGVPLWQDPSLIAAEGARDATTGDARTFAGELARTLGLSADSPIPAYEDAAHFMLLEQKLPLGVAPESNLLAEAAERERIMRAFDRGLGNPVGHVLPLLATHDAAGKRRFVTERWAFRRGHLFLLPGSLPAGLRLPLAGLPEIDFVDFPHVEPADPFADRRALPQPAREPAAAAPCSATAPASSTDTLQPVRTALAVELRDGHICVFLPPLADGADYALLIGAIESTAARTRQPVRLEGYEPPFDPRLRNIKVTPDPGVLEINVHPAVSWDAAVDITSTVYEEAAALDLGAEKFRLDGRRVGTGGGSHIVAGGITPADSPFLRRPDLLASAIAYWQSHPALSYLFAGQFVGPTSQAPRVDEARHESLYELEIAFAQVPQPGGTIAPWLVDRLFRNLLVDATGNTHRAEICIDKLYAPEGPMGRLGLVEFRAFEMAPHVRMSLAQQLLVRALLAWFWERPYRRPLVRRGTALHDRFMLPHVLWADFESIIADLGDAGFPLQARWFAPHFEFRFPVLGSVEHAGIGLELRQALEPWLVLGDQSGPGAATRTVDSSMERIEARVEGPRGDRYVVTCNGHPLPLAPIGGAAVAGVRFRAWPSPEGFHPNIPPHVPLTFDVIDTWNGRSVGGCRWHVAHPGGRIFQALPVNALEAQSRRLALFESMGHSPGASPLRPGGIHPDFPLTLDLRRAGLEG